MEQLNECNLCGSTRHALFAHDWPANVRELEHCIVQAAVLAGGGTIETSHLPRAVLEGAARHAAARGPALSAEDESLRQRLVASLTEHHGNVADVARTFGKARMQIHRWLKRFGLDADAFR